MKNKIAILDLGTNTFHLMLAEWNGSRYEIIHRECCAVKIGMGGINSDFITNEGQQRAINALKIFKNTIDTYAIKTSYAFATSAFRKAGNGKAVADKIKEETGITIKIISGDEEADLIFEGVRSGLKLGHEKSLIMDIGGGSVEFIIGNENEIFWKHSFEIGAQRLLEKFQKHDPILKEEIEELNFYFENQLQKLFEALGQHQPKTLIGSSGTFDTLSDIFCVDNHLHKNENDAETPLTFEGFYATYKKLIIKNRAERLQIEGMMELRVDMIVVACCLIDYLLSNYVFKNIRVSRYALKEGVLASMK